MIEHNCDQGKCQNRVTECFCEPCLEDLKETAYNEGYLEGKRDAEEYSDE